MILVTLIFITFVWLVLPIGYKSFKELTYQKRLKESEKRIGNSVQQIIAEEQKTQEKKARIREKSVIKVETPETLKKFFKTIGKQSSSVREKTKEARKQFEKLDEFELTICKFEQIAFNKIVIGELRESLQSVRDHIMQNMRDIKTILLTEQPGQNFPISKAGLKCIERELESNNKFIEQFSQLLAEAGRNSIQQDDAFSDMDIKASRTALNNYYISKNNNVDNISPHNKTAL